MRYHLFLTFTLTCIILSITFDRVYAAGCSNNGGKSCDQSRPCCSEWGYCGSGEAYCGRGCDKTGSHQGSCTSSPPSTNSTTPPPTTLKTCLKGVTGKVVYKGDPTYSEDIKDENSAVQYSPSAILYAANVKDVQTAVGCASSLKLIISPRSGGHSYESYSLGGTNNALVVDLTSLNTIDIASSDKTATIGTGNRLGHIYDKLSQAGFIIPAGSCPSVGIGGHSLGGGYGLYSRKYGLATDLIISADMVDAKGNLITATTTNSQSDLLFALRGAGGGSYGIVTSITFKLQTVPPQVTSFQYNWPVDKAHQLVPAVVQFSTQGTNDVTFSLSWGKDGFTLQGVYIGTQSGVQNALQSILKVPGSQQQTLTQQSFFDSVVLFSGTNANSVRNPQRSPYNFKAKSFFVGKSGLSSAGIDALNNFLATTTCNTYSILDVFGGVINTISPDATAFVHRDMTVGIQLVSEWTDASQRTSCVNSLKQFGNTFQEQHTTPFSYQNYIDRDLTNWQQAYYGDNFARLVQVKKKYDPDNLFNFPQSIPTQ